jgi:membrane protein DedA with SNARE-associated domain
MKRLLAILALAIGFVVLATHSPMLAVGLIIVAGVLLGIASPFLLGAYFGRRSSRIRERNWEENRRNAELVAERHWRS